MPPKVGSPQRGGWPHKHPSLNCYKNHKCRCAACKALQAKANVDARRKRRERQAQGKHPLPPKSVNAQKAPREKGVKLSPIEVESLRRMVGYDPNKDYRHEDQLETWKEKKRVKHYARLTVKSN